jgi:succinate dehydrogenase / fumarate reductase cytochrome b subunit
MTDRVARPLSPHLQVYRWQIAMTLSILHRGTGLALSLGLPVLVYWLLSLASGPAAYAGAQVWLGSVWLKLCYAGWAFCFFYHLANGIRHLAWDLGYGFERSQIARSGWTVVAVAATATVLFAASVIV